MPSGPWSIASARVIMITPALAAEYTAAPGSPWMPESLATLTITPLLRVTMCAIACLHMKYVPLRQIPVSYTHLRAHETRHDLVCRLLLEKKKKDNKNNRTDTHQTKKQKYKQQNHRHS